METRTENLTIGALAESTGVNVESIRYYQRKGLLEKPEKPHGSIRRYGSDDLARVRFIKAAQRLGFSLDEVAELLQLEDGAEWQAAHQMAERKLEAIRDRLADLQRIEAALRDLVGNCGAGSGSVKCSLIAALRRG